MSATYRRSSRTSPNGVPSGMYTRGLHVAYSGAEVLKGVDLVIRPGLVTAVMGPSGCGKSTFLRCLNRLNDLVPGCVVRGEVYLDREDVSTTDPALLRRQVGMVFQRPNPFPMSIRENVLYGIKATRLEVDYVRTVRAALSRAALWDEVKHRLDKSAMTLSLGQQQRLCIARALAVSPKVILMDEPAASLDPSSASQVEATINRMRGDYTVVIVTHNLQQASRVSDYAAFLYEGKLVEYGLTQEVFDNPQHELTKSYVSGKFS
jgi:phosphate transport system ATP-binding protein